MMQILDCYLIHNEYVQLDVQIRHVLQAQSLHISYNVDSVIIS